MHKWIANTQWLRLSFRILFGVLALLAWQLAFTLPLVQATDVCGLISSNTTWTAANNPYIVTCGVLVEPGVTLTIEPDVIVKFDSLTALTIQGTLVARGTEVNPITFTSNQASPTKGDWAYIHFTDSSTNATFDGEGNYTGGSIIQYVIIEYAGGTSVSENGALRIEDSAPYVDHNIISNNKAAGVHVWCNLSNCPGNEPRITNNTVTQNGIVGSTEAKGISVTRQDGGEYPNNCIISDNGVSKNAGLGIHSACSGGTIGDNIVTGNMGSGIMAGGAPTISGNTISGNSTPVGPPLDVFNHGGGIHFLVWGQGATVISNTVSGNSATDRGGGIYIKFLNSGSSVTIRENIIIDNTAYNGGGLFVEHNGPATANISNNIVANNATTSGAGGGAYIASGNATLTHNSIISNSAFTAGGGLHVSTTLPITNNTIINNEVTQIDGQGGGINLWNHPFINDNNLYNNIGDFGSTFYNNNVSGGADVNAENNYWGTTDSGAIESQVWHFLDDPSLGIVDYTPFRTSHNLDAPISPPTGLAVNPNGTSISLNWFPNPESDVAGYKVYYDIDSEFPYNGTGANEGDSPIDIGNNTSFTLTGLASGTQYFVVVTAYDTDADGLKDQTDGHESWFSVSPTSLTQNYVQVSYDHGGAASGAEVYHNGSFVGTTDGLGQLTLTQPLEIGDTLSAIQQLAETPTVRNAHNGWAYRTYITSLDIDALGNIQAHTVTQPGPQLLTVRPENTLILFNLVVSIEWDATDAYIQDLAQAVDKAADFLYDASDGQMTFGQVAIYDNAEHWSDADLQISAKNVVHPHAYIGGIFENEDTSHLIRVGRFWDGNTSSQGNWSLPNGFKTLVHEFGHYGLGLYDEYFGYDQVGDDLAGEHDAFCTGPENRLSPDPVGGASIMDFHYTTSELADASRWTAWCQLTAQHQLNNGEADWQTLVRLYGDPSGQDQWQLVTPDQRVGAGEAVLGPETVPTALPFPMVTPANLGSDPAAFSLSVCQNGEPYRDGAWVTLYFSGKAMDQGLTDPNGRLDILGAQAGDSLRVVSLDGVLSGITLVPPPSCLDLSPPGVNALNNGNTGPYLRLWPTTDTSGLLDGMRLVVTRTLPSDSLTYALTGADNIGPSDTIPYNSTTTDHRVQVTFVPAALAGHAKVLGSHAGQFFDLNVDYRLQQASNISDTTLFSNDGNMSLHLGPGSLPLSTIHFLIASPWGLPGPLPNGYDIVGEAYEITASDSLIALGKPAVLRLSYDGAQVNTQSPPEGLDIYRWDSSDEMWQAVGSSLDEEQKSMAAPVTTLGIYALLAPFGPWNEPPQNTTFLPIILKN